MPVLFLAESRLPRVGELLEGGRTIAVVPIGSLEQHGPHLPMGTDSIVAEAVVREAVRSLGDLDLLVLPTVWFGCSEEHMDFPGTVSLDAGTMMRLVRDLCSSLARHGVRKVALVNAHGGNTDVLRAVLREVRRDLGVFAVLFDVWPLIKVLLRPEDLPEVHAGWVETSILMTLRPELVGPAGPDEFPERGRRIRLGGRGVSTPWATSDVSRSGVIGYPSAADPERGREILRRMAEELAEALRELDSLELP